MTMHIGKNISYLRKLKGVHQKEMADKMGMSQQNYSIIEQKQHVSEELIKQIAEILEYPVEAFSLPDLDQKVNNVFQKNGDHASVFSYNYDSSDKVETLYKQLLIEKDELIKELKKRLDIYENPNRGNS